MKTNKLLITRFSAMGDVAMCIPVVWSLATKYTTVEIIFLSRKNFEPMFSRMPSNVRFWGVDLKNDYKGISGLNKLFAEIKALDLYAFADFHGVLRTHYLRARAHIAGIKTKKIDKGRSDKKRLTTKGAAACETLPSTFQRYQDVLAELGFDFETKFETIFPDGPEPMSPDVTAVTGPKDTLWVGIAPFAAHKGKILPPETIEKVIQILNGHGAKVLLFGAGDKEKAILENWQAKYPNAISTAGRLNGLYNELTLISNLDCMVSMDSANMHLASLVGIRTVSIWGATHPAAGFLGYNQSEQSAVQIDLPCRPCSVYGNKKCRLAQQYKCLTDITAEQIVEKIMEKSPLNSQKETAMAPPTI